MYTPHFHFHFESCNKLTQACLQCAHLIFFGFVPRRSGVAWSDSVFVVISLFLGAHDVSRELEHAR